MALSKYETWPPSLSLSLTEENKMKMFEKRELRRIFGPKREEVKGGWKKGHNEEINDLYSSTYIIRVIKSRMMRWARNVAHERDEKCISNFLQLSP